MFRDRHGVPFSRVFRILLYCKPCGCQLVENLSALQLRNLISSSMNMNFRHKYTNMGNTNTYTLKEIISVHHGKRIAKEQLNDTTLNFIVLNT